ncbi:MAG: hypothetical protein ACO4CH_12435 [Saprospiraceae bacterium]
MNDPYVQKFLNGLGIAISIAAVVMLIVGIWASADPEPVENFKVVDRYKNCSVIRYTDSTNRWNYLLHCPL